MKVETGFQVRVAQVMAGLKVPSYWYWYGLQGAEEAFAEGQAQLEPEPAVRFGIQPMGRPARLEGTPWIPHLVGRGSCHAEGAETAELTPGRRILGQAGNRTGCGKKGEKDRFAPHATSLVSLDIYKISEFRK